MGVGPAEISSASVDRVREALRGAGHDDAVTTFPAATRSAAEAAVAIGCPVAAIAKSVILRAGDVAVLVVASGADRVDTGRVASLTGLPITRADAAFVRATTGFAIGGVAPIGHLTPPVVIIEDALFALVHVWAAAGHPNTVFRTTAADLLRMTGGRRAAVAETPAPGLNPPS